jgi:TRAP-type C4-dicarboxylate transport system substrate-binding protein
MKRLLLVTLAVIVIFSLVVAGCTAQTTPSTQPAKPAEVIKLKAISFQDITSGTTQHFNVYLDELRKRGKDKIAIEYVGGPEVIGRADQPTAAKNGVVDLVYMAFTFYGGTVPVGQILSLTEISGKEERNRGVWDYVRELHAKAGLYWLGRGHSSSGEDQLWSSTKKITSMKDLAGQKAGSGSVVSKPFVQAVGANYVQVQVGDVYTALERGVLDSYIAPPGGTVSSAAHKICKNFIDHPFYRGNISIFIGMERWNKLPKDIQTLLQGTLYDMEDELNKQWDSINAVDKQKMVDSGDVPVKLSPDEAQKYLSLAYKAGREDALKAFPDTAPKLLEMLKK